MSCVMVSGRSQESSQFLIKEIPQTGIKLSGLHFPLSEAIGPQNPGTTQIFGGIKTAGFFSFQTSSLFFVKQQKTYKNPVYKLQTCHEAIPLASICIINLILLKGPDTTSKHSKYIPPAVSKPDIFRSVQPECILNYSTTHQVRTLLDEHGNSRAQRLVCQKKHRLLQKRYFGCLPCFSDKAK